jgi:UPF0755 protein
MIDELDLAFEEQGEKGPSRHRRSRKKGGAGKSAVAFLVAFLLLGGLAGGAWYGYDRVKGYFTAADYEGPGAGEVQVQIKKNATHTDMGNALVEADVVKSAAAFIEAAGANPRGKNIQDGTYKLRKQMAAEDVVTAMLDPATRVTNGVTIPEGKTAKEVFALISAKTRIPVADYEAAAKDPQALGVADFWFVRKDGKPVAKSIEGFLFPDTYEFDPKATAADHLGDMVARFNTVVEETRFIDQVESKLFVTPFEGLIVASLAQAEAGIAEDLPNVARVAYNRAYKAKIPLQFDVTTNYWLQLQGKGAKHSGKLLRSEMEDPRNPYNTETKAGLPVGPINNPGKAALEGAANPPDKNWLFFVAIDKSGKSAFADTNEQHDKNIQQACRNGIPLC